MQTPILILSLSLFSTLALSNQNSQLFNDDPNQILVQYETNDVGYIPVVSKEEPYHAMRTVEVGEYIYYNEYFNHCTQKNVSVKFIESENNGVTQTTPLLTKTNKIVKCPKNFNSSKLITKAVLEELK